MADTVTAQGIGGARSGPGAGPPMVAMCRDGTPGKPGFRRSRKCAQMRVCQNLIYLLILCKWKHYMLHFTEKSSADGGCGVSEGMLDKFFYFRV
jgi:hypothetical protein